MGKSLKILPLLLVASLTACNGGKKSGAGYYFYTELSYTLYASNSEVVKKIKNECQSIDNYSNPYEKRNVTNVYDLNQTNEEIIIPRELYNLLMLSMKAREVAKNFTPLIGSLSDKWKEALGKDNPEPLSNDVITKEVDKIRSSAYALRKDGNVCYAERIGEATIDLGAITKGYALDRIYEHLQFYNVTDYIINAGSSSILLGKNSHTQTWNGQKETTYTVSLRDFPGTRFKAQDCVISSSGNQVQGVEINGTMYSHIINPNTGSAIMENDAVIVILKPSLGYLGDALSTSMMMNTEKEIKEIEKETGAKTIVVKDNKITYSHPDINFVN